MERSDSLHVYTKGKGALQVSRSKALRFLTSPITLWASCDLLAVFIAFLCAIQIHYGGMQPAGEHLGSLYLPTALFAGCFVAAILTVGLYRVLHRTNAYGIAARLAVATVIAGVFDALVFYTFPVIDVGQAVLGTALLVSFIVVTATRLLLAKLVDANPFRSRVVVVGTGVAARKIQMLRRNSDRRRFKVIAYWDPSAISADSESSTFNAPVISDPEHLRALDYDEMVVALDNRRDQYPTELLIEEKMRGRKIVSLVDFLERATGRIELDIVSPDWFVFTDSCYSDRISSFGKRAVDILVSSLILLLTSPMIVATALALCVECRFRNPILYRQTRVGKDGREFRLLKFRSMNMDAEVDGTVRWSTPNDHRKTRVGRIIRRLRIDELPQLVNILKGDMSLVGPRPERPEFVSQLADQIPMYEYRHSIKPGLTGWAQLCYPYGSSVSDAREKFKYDLFYVKNGKFAFDIFVLAQTVEIVLWRRGLSMSGQLENNVVELPTAQLPYLHRRQDKVG